jgi:hypothetical protein
MKIVFWDFLTFIVVVLILMVGGYYLLIFFNPYVGLNPLPPPALPQVLEIKIATSTATLRSLPSTWTPEGAVSQAENLVPGGPTKRPSRTLTPSKTFTPSKSPIPSATLSPTVTRTIDPTLITYTPTPTLTRTPTNTLDPAVATGQALTQSALLTSEARAAKTEAAQETKNAYAAYLTQQALSVIQTQNAYNANLTQQALYQTQTAAPALTNAAATTTQAAADAQATAVAATATAQQATMVQATANAVATIAVQATQVREAPIAISIDVGAGGAPYENIDSYQMLGGAGTLLSSITLTGTFNQASEISSWWLDDSFNLWYLMFSDSAALEPINLVQYNNIGTNFNIDTPAGTHTHPIVSAQSGAASSRWVIYTRAEGGAGTDRNLWRIHGDGADVGSLSSNTDFDDHDPFWTPDGRVLYASGTAAGADNLFLLTPGGTPPGDQLTYYTGVVEIGSPKWCKSWDWTSEVWLNTILFARRSSPADQWDIYSAQVDDWTTLTNLTNTGGASETDPDWSPYCERIVYVSDSGGTDVWHMARDGSDQTQMTGDANANIEVNPLWRPQP